MTVFDQPNRNKQGNSPPKPAYYDDLDEAYDTAWTLLEIGAAKSKSAFHTPSVATITQTGHPTTRTVVLRGTERSKRRLRFHTDRRSGKFAELTANPSCELLFYDPQKKIQLRIPGLAKIENGTDHCRTLWAAMQNYSQACYKQPVKPGDTIDAPHAYTPSTHRPECYGFGNFCLVWVEVTAIQWLYLAARGHRRAHFDLTGSEPSLSWIAP